MIIVNIKGGLGNQMFQYALGRRLSLIERQDIKFDKTGYRDGGYRSYGLGFFNVEQSFANTDEIKRLKYPYGPISKIWRLFKSRVLRIRYTGWEPKKLIQTKNAYLDGYWQSYKYFEDIRETLVKDFSLKIPLEQTHPELLAKISSPNSVSLAVRRTDYLLPINLKNIGVCSADYYNRAIKIVEEKITSPSFFVVCDDLDWVRNNIGFHNHPVTFVSELRKNNSITDYQELILMSKCKHNIIANSSFSWWSAWLNENPDKIVIAPDVWFNNSSLKIDDIVFPTWIKLPRN